MLLFCSGTRKSHSPSGPLLTRCAETWTALLQLLSWWRTLSSGWRQECGKWRHLGLVRPRAETGPSSLLPTFSWQKRVTWPSPKSRTGEKDQREGFRHPATKGLDAQRGEDSGPTISLPPTLQEWVSHSGCLRISVIRSSCLFA